MRSVNDSVPRAASSGAQRAIVGSARARARRLRCLILGAGLAAIGLLASHPVTAVDASAVEWESQPSPSSFEDLLAGFEQMPGFEARFEEEKTLALLVAPLRSSGRLYFAPPSMLLRRVEKPRASEILVTSEHVRISDDTNEQVIDLASRPEARPLVESMLWLFSGDQAAIERSYQVDYQVLDQGWALRMLPKHAPLDRLITELRIRGVGRRVVSVELLEATGDRTLTRILDANPARRFGAEERSRLFGAPAP